MLKRQLGIVLILTAIAFGLTGCESESQQGAQPISTELRGASSYTPYDAFSMLWAQGRSDRTMVWVSSGGEAGRLLVSEAAPEKRPDWVLCTQGVVAGLAARGEDVVIIGTTYHSQDVILPVYRKPRRPWKNARSLFIPRSSIEFAFDRLLEREGVPRSDIRIPSVESVGFSTIASMLGKPVEDADALDFALLVDPFITNLLTEQPNSYQLGEGGLYDLYYSIVVRRLDLEARRQVFVELLRHFLSIDERLHSVASEEDFYDTVWGRLKDGKPDRLPRMLTYDRRPARLYLPTTALRRSLRAELQHLTSKYPDTLRMPQDVEALVDPSLLAEVAPGKVEQ